MYCFTYSPKLFFRRLIRRTIGLLIKSSLLSFFIKKQFVSPFISILLKVFISLVSINYLPFFFINLWMFSLVCLYVDLIGFFKSFSCSLFENLYKLNVLSQFIPLCLRKECFVYADFRFWVKDFYKKL